MELVDKYYPIEVNNQLTEEQKTPYMIEWWTQAHQLLIDQKINKDDVAAMVAETPVDIREGLKELIEKCKEKNIPLLVFSAGVKSNYYLLLLLCFILFLWKKKLIKNF